MAASDKPTVQESPAAAATAPEARARRSALLTVFLVVFIDLLGFGIVLPLLPLYADELLEPLFPGDAHRALRGGILGLLMASFSAMQFLFAPVWGRVSDRIGRRPILLLGLFGSVVFYTLFGVASELGARGWLALGVVLLFAARLGAGVAGATISTAQAVIADCTPADRRAHGMALIGAAFGIGFTFGPLIGYGALFLPSPGAPGFIAAGLSLAALILGWSLFHETLRAGSTTGLRRQLIDWEGVRRVMKTPTVGLLVLTFFLTTIAFGGLESTLAFVSKLLQEGSVERHLELSREAARTTERKTFLVFAYVGFILMLTQGLLYRRLVKRVGEVRFLRAGVVLMALGLVGAVAVLLLQPQVENLVALWTMALAVMTVAVMGFAFVTPSIQSLISRRTDPARQGETLGVNQSGAALARILGPFLGVQLFFLQPSHTLPYSLGAAVLAGVWLLTARLGPD